MLSKTSSPPVELAAALPRPAMLGALRSALPRWDSGAAWVLTFLAGFLHLYLWSQHYPLWRDEVNTTQLATYPHVADTLKFLPFDSCPLVFLGLARTWAAVFPGVEDFHLRALGLIIGLGVLGTLWLCVRAMGVSFPLVSMALLGFNPVFVRYGDSVRPYGVGILFALLAVLTIWRVVEQARPGRVVLAMVVGVLAVNAVFYNAVLLLAACASAATVVLLAEKSWRKALFILSIGAPAAASLLVYGAMFREQHRWAFLLSYPVDAAWLWKRLCDATDSPDPVGVWVWPALCVGMLGWAGWHFAPRIRSPERWTRGEQATAYAALTLFVGTTGYAVFLKVLQYHTQPWYYVTILAVAGICLDVLCARLVETSFHAVGWRVGRLMFVLGFAALTFFPAQLELFTRPTNVDLVARAVAARAGKDDLVVHARWECAITFDHYYHGAAPQVTLPPLADHRVHRYDLVLDQMMTPNAAQPVLDRMAQTLRDGHQIYFVGSPYLPPAGRSVPDLKPIYKGPKGWRASGDYYTTWVMQASVLLAKHATHAELVPTPTGRPVLYYEALQLCILEGWKP